MQQVEQRTHQGSQTVNYDHGNHTYRVYAERGNEVDGYVTRSAEAEKDNRKTPVIRIGKVVHYESDHHGDARYQHQNKRYVLYRIRPVCLQDNTEEYEYECHCQLQGISSEIAPFHDTYIKLIYCYMQMFNAKILI